MPTYDALMEQFGVTRPTVARVVAALRDEGLVTSHGERSLFVSDQLPHHNRYLWVTSEQPGSFEWTNFLATFLELEEADPCVHMHIGGIMVFDPQPDGATPSLEQLSAIADKSLR